MHSTARLSIYEDYFTIIAAFDLTILNITPFFDKYAFIAKLPRPCCLIAPVEDLTPFLSKLNGVLYSREIISNDIVITNQFNLPSMKDEYLIVIDHGHKLFDIDRLREYFFCAPKVVLLNYQNQSLQLGDFDREGIVINYHLGYRDTAIGDFVFFVNLFLFFAIYGKRPVDLIGGHNLIDFVAATLNNWKVSYDVVFIDKRAILKVAGSGVKRVFGEKALDDRILDEYREELEVYYLLHGSIAWMDKIRLIGYRLLLHWFFDFREIVSEFKIRCNID
jgi:hypothetical protein